MARNREQVTYGPQYFTKERDHAYSDLGTAFHRENIQNSVDAGATRIDINIDNLADNVTRIEIIDDGCGMTEETLRKVFFRLGESTKDSHGEQTGGYGRARVLTHFAMHKYVIDTLDNHVIGIGGSYQFIKRKTPVTGCRMIIFAVRKDRYGWTIDWEDKLRVFLRRCQLPSHVYINGDRFCGWSYRRQATRNLSFGTVYVNKSAEEHRVLVRVNGTLMFEDSTTVKAQIIVEITPSISRDVLTSNRDGLNYEQRNEFRSFIEEINRDKTALEVKQDEIIEITGTGIFNHSRKDDGPAILVPDYSFSTDSEHSQFPDEATIVTNPMDEIIPPPQPKMRDDSLTLPSVVEGTGVPRNATIVEGELSNSSYTGTAVEEENPEVAAFREELREGMEHGHPAVPNSPPKTEITQQQRNRLFTVIINNRTGQIEDEVLRRKVRKQIASFNPNNWKVVNRPGQGKTFTGGAKAKLLLAWKTLCHFAVDEYLKVTEEESVTWGVGWLFGPHKTISQVRTHNDATFFLLNPLAEDATLGWRYSDKAQWYELLLCAAAQVTHMKEKYHDQDYSDFYQKIVLRLINRLPEIKKAVQKIAKVKMV